MFIMNMGFYNLRLWRAVARLEWSALCLIVLLHMAITYFGLFLAGEDHLQNPLTFAYYYFTTASTIGYGDLSPVTVAGRTFAFIWIFPGALSFYMVLLTKFNQGATAAWRKRMDGHGNLAKDRGRSIIVGYLPGVTHRIFKDLLAGGLKESEIVLIATRRPTFNYDNIDFILTEDLANAEDLRRAGVEFAKNVLVLGPDDNATFTAAMAVSHIAKDAHIVAAVECETRAALMKSHTNVVPVVSQSPEVVASELLDPGVGQVLSVLGAASTGVTAFSLRPDGQQIIAGAAHGAFRLLGMTFLGAQCPDGGMMLNLEDDVDVTGLPLFYISQVRVDREKFNEAILINEKW